MIRLVSVTALAMASLAVAAPARAQSDEDRAVAAERQSEDSAALVSAGSPPDRAMAGFFEPIISVTTEDGETKASAAFSFDLSRDKGPKPGEIFNTVGRTKFSVVATAPIESDPGKALSSLFAGDSLIKGSKVKLALSHMSNKLGTGEGGQKYVDEAYPACVSLEAGNWVAANSDRARPLAHYMQVLNAKVADTRGDYQIALEELAVEPAEPALYAHLVQNCVPATGRKFESPGEFIDEYSSRPDEFWALFIDKDALGWFAGIDASAGQDDYAYLDRTTFSMPEVNRTAWEIGVYAGLLNWDATFSARARVVYGHTWELPDEGEACETVGDPPAEQCLTGPDGPPKRVDTGLVSIETRHLFKIDAERTIALAPQITWRMEENAIGVEVPVYLAPDKDGQLTGGLKFAWTSKDDEFGVGVFVGVPFGGVLPN